MSAPAAKKAKIESLEEEMATLNKFQDQLEEVNEKARYG